MDSGGYDKLFDELGFHDVELRKKLKHSKVIPTVYYNRNREGFVYFTVYSKARHLFRDNLWNFIAPQQKKDDKEKLRTVVPKTGKERAAFSDLLGSIVDSRVESYLPTKEDVELAASQISSGVEGNINSILDMVERSILNNGKKLQDNWRAITEGSIKKIWFV